MIGYYDQEANRVKVVKCTNAACSIGTSVSVVDLNVGDHASLAIGADGLSGGRLSRHRQHRTEGGQVRRCGVHRPATVTIVDNVADVGYLTSIAMGADGLPVISYFDNTNKDLKVAKCNNASCTGTSTISVVDSFQDIGWFTSITLGADGLPVVAYHDMTNGNLKVVKCSSATCMPFVRSR